MALWLLILLLLNQVDSEAVQEWFGLLALYLLLLPLLCGFD